jgi:hypothetical protein
MYDRSHDEALRFRMKRSSMADALSQVAGLPGKQSPQHVDALPSYAPIDTRADVPKTSLPPSRVGKKPITGFFDPSVSKQLRKLALDEDSTVQDLVREALNDLFRKKGLPPIA